MDTRTATTTDTNDGIDLTTTGVALPEFALAMRGYDRLQVDEYIGRLDRWMEEATARTQVAETELDIVCADFDRARKTAEQAAKDGFAALLVPSVCPRTHSPSHIGLFPVWRAAEEGRSDLTPASTSRPPSRPVPAVPSRHRRRPG